MTAIHIVKPGEHIGVIAARFGFENFSEIWDHPENAKLKELRKVPFVLHAGDQVFIPDRVQLVFDRATAATHDFKVNIDRLKLQLRLLDLEAKPKASAPVTVQVDPPETGAAASSAEQKLTTDGDGRVSVEMSKTCVVGGLIIDKLEFELHVGGLDPLDTETGLGQRLTNLGYFVPPPQDGVVQDAGGAPPDAGSTSEGSTSEGSTSEGSTSEGSTSEGSTSAEAGEPSDTPQVSDDLRSAIEEFQCDQGLPVNGKRDDAAMLAKLEELHGS